MADFDLLDDAEEILQPLCVCLNQDSSRVGVGHHKGYVVYRVHRTSSGSSTGNGTASSTAAVGGEAEITSARPPFFTTVETVYPPRRSSTVSSPSTWDVRVNTPRQNSNVGGGVTVSFPSQSNGSRCQLDKFEENDTEAQPSPIAGDSPLPPLQHSTEASDGVDAEGFHVQGEKPTAAVVAAAAAAATTTTSEEPGAAVGDTIAISTVGSECLAESPSTTKTVLELRSSQLVSIEGHAPQPTETGVGVMALLYKTQFVAVVGGGPYPTGPRNVVKLFVSGGMWADRSVRVPDAVEGLRLDHRLIIIFTTRELRLHSFETGQCVFTLPVRNDGAPCSSVPTSLPSVFSSSSSTTPFSSSFLRGPSAQASVTTAASTNSWTPGEGYVRYVTPLAIDYSKKCLAFRSSQRGFSLVRYDAESSPCSRMGAELLATVPVAHEHRLASLAMDLSSDCSTSGGVGGGCKRWHIATCSEHATLIRIWRYVDREQSLHHVRNGSTSSTSGTTTSTSGGGGGVGGSRGCDTGVFPGGDGGNRNSSSNVEDQLPGYFEKIKEVRNAALPMPIFQMQFLGANFLFCIAWNTLKVFFVGEQEEPKPYDISTKNPSKAMHTHNNHSSLHHLGLVSAYFKSEWAACECPLPLTDAAFLPKWVHATTGEFRQHLLRGMGAPSKDTAAAAAAACGRNMRPMEVETSLCSVTDAQQPQSGTQGTQTRFPPQTASKSSSQKWGDAFRRYVSLQMAPIVGGASRTSIGYWMASGNDNNSRDNNKISGDGDVTKATPYGAGCRNEAGSNMSQQRDYSTMDDIAQALVVWWEQPAYWQLDCMMNAMMRAGTGGSLPSNLARSRGMTVLYCVTCDGSAVSFEFDHVAGTIRCSKAAAVLTCEEQT